MSRVMGNELIQGATGREEIESLTERVPARVKDTGKV